MMSDISYVLIKHIDISDILIFKINLKIFFYLKTL